MIGYISLALIWVFFIIYWVGYYFWKKKNIDTKPTKGWAKVEDKYDGPWAWTEYTDHDGMVYRIYDIMAEPGFKDAIMKTDK